MKALLLVVCALLTFPAIAENGEGVIVTKVTIETPLPTGLESVIQPPELNPLYKRIAEHNDVKPYIAIAESLNNVVHNDPLLATKGAVTTDCSQNPVQFGERDLKYCAFVATRNFGWYADLSLIIRIEGYIERIID